MSGLARTLRADRIGYEPESVVLTANSADRTALIERFDLVDLPALTADLVVRKRAETGWISVTGYVRATVVQTCVITLEPVKATLTTAMEELFQIGAEPDTAEIDIDPLADAPEPLEDGVLDLAELVAQAFGLSLDPYPRSSDALMPEAVDGTTDPAVEASPFAKLAGLVPENSGLAKPRDDNDA